MTPMKEMMKKGTDSGYSLCIMGNLNGWIGDRTGAFGVLDKNDNGRRVIEFCAERDLCVGNIF